VNLRRAGENFSHGLNKGDAISQYFQGATWQRCQTHFMRNILDKTPKQLQKEIHGKVRAILEAPDLETARMLLKEVLEEYKEKAPKTMEYIGRRV